MSNSKPCQPVKLEKSFDRSQFSSGALELDEWLAKYSWQNQRANNATTYVTHVDGLVVGYYAITVASYERTGAPESIAKGAPVQVPCILLARLAVDENWKGRGLGAALLNDALRRAVFISQSVAARAVLVHARDDDARAFYLKLGDFLQSPVDQLHLMAPIKELQNMPEYQSNLH